MTATTRPSDRVQERERPTVGGAKLYILDAKGKRVSGLHGWGIVTIPAGGSLWDGSGDPGYYIFHSTTLRQPMTIEVWEEHGNWLYCLLPSPPPSASVGLATRGTDQSRTELL